jgi:hypothetical protein
LPNLIRRSRASTRPSEASAHVPTRDVRPESKGEGYTYVVDKFWIVKQIAGNQIIALTRTGKLHELDASDPRLHRASWWQKLIYKSMFPKRPEESADIKTGD